MAITNEILISDLEFGNRIDGELYNPNLRASFSKLLKTGFDLKQLREICWIRSGTTPPDRDDNLRHGPVLFKTTDIRNNIIGPSNDYYHISPKIHDRMWNTKLQHQDVLLNIVGATLDVIGRVGFTADNFNSANITQAMVLLRPKTNRLRPGFMFAFMCSRFAQDQIKRYARPTGQYNLNLQEVGYIRIPLFLQTKQDKIHKGIMDAAAKLTESIYFHDQAIQTLETKLGLDKLQFEKSVGYEICLGDLMNGRRIDAQCYKPEYVNYEHYLRKHYNFDYLRDLVFKMVKGKQMSVLPSGVFNYASIKDISGIELISDEFCQNSNAVRLADQQDLLLAITGATIGKIGINERYRQLAFSGDLLALKVHESIDPYYLITVLEGPIGQSQFQRWITGSTNGHLSPSDVGKIVVPRLSDDIEKRISKTTKESLNAKFESEQLLEKSKQRVEELIEEAIKHEPIR